MDILIFIVRILLTILLYAFLASVFVVLWRDLRTEAETHSVVEVRKAHLLVLSGGESVEPNAVFPLEPFTTLGRNPANTIVLPDAFASAEHAIVSWRGGQWWLEDVGSRNGTQLNDEPVTVPTVMSAGDVISIGQVKLKFQTSNGKSQSSASRKGEIDEPQSAKADAHFEI